MSESQSDMNGCDKSRAENKLVDCFIKDIKTYPFKTTILTEAYCDVGRIDVVLEDYNVAIEAKSDNGSIKKGIGQAVSYASVTEFNTYLLVWSDMIENWILKAAEDAGVGVVSTARGTPNFRLEVDVGGFESFYPQHYTGQIGLNISGVDGSRDREVVGGNGNI